MRLKELDHPYSIMYNSSMARAKETSDIIAEYLPNVPRSECDLLREGAPIPPEPPVGHWKPEIRVGLQFGFVVIPCHRHVRPLRLRGFLHFLFPKFAFFHATPHVLLS